MQTGDSSATPGLDIQDFSIRLAETITWCRLRTAHDDPRHCLRSSALMPAHRKPGMDDRGNVEFEWGTAAENQAVVRDLALRRAELLRAENANVRVESLLSIHEQGRLLLADPQQSDVCGLSVAESDGFIDADDVPPWDTWVWFGSEPMTPDPEQLRRTQESYRTLYRSEWRPPTSVSYVLCWVPAPFLELVEQGILVNPVECLFWAVDYKRHHYNTALLQRLDAAGMLR